MLAKNGKETVLWAREPEVAAKIRETRENKVFLPGRILSDKLAVDTTRPSSLTGPTISWWSSPASSSGPPSRGSRTSCPTTRSSSCASKGIELDTLAPMSRVVAQSLKGKAPRYASLSGPSFAAEVSDDMPTSVSLGCEDHDLGRELQEAFSTPYFRVYFTPDYRGVELGGAVKNVIAIAAGIADGLGFGHDARAALITRGLAELSRLGQAMGGQERTFMGLSGMGDWS